MIVDIGTSCYGHVLRVRLVELEMSGRALARMLGVDPAQVSHWITGRSEPSLASLRRIEAVLHPLETL